MSGTSGRGRNVLAGNGRGGLMEREYIRIYCCGAWVATYNIGDVSAIVVENKKVKK